VKVLIRLLACDLQPNAIAGFRKGWIAGYLL